jgi:hypothetical protein
VKSGYQNTFYWGTLKGVGKVHVQVVVDVFCSFAFAKIPRRCQTACDLLYDRGSGAAGLLGLLP